MPKERIQRRLAAILAADMVGYSRLMEKDEEGTIARLKAHRAELIDPKIAEHGGRIAKTTGDGLLVEFASAVDAVRCATENQAVHQILRIVPTFSVNRVRRIPMFIRSADVERLLEGLRLAGLPE